MWVQLECWVLCFLLLLLFLPVNFANLWVACVRVFFGGFESRQRDSSLLSYKQQHTSTHIFCSYQLWLVNRLMCFGFGLVFGFSFWPFSAVCYCISTVFVGWLLMMLLAGLLGCCLCLLFDIRMTGWTLFVCCMYVCLSVGRLWWSWRRWSFSKI